MEPMSQAFYLRAVISVLRFRRACRQAGFRRLATLCGKRIHPLIGYLLTCGWTGAWPGSVQVPGPPLSHRLPALVVWLSFGLRRPGAANLGEERLNPHATGTLPWPQYRSWNRQVMTIQAADDSEVLTAAQVNATHDCGFWDSIAPKF
jgi:hypothetical protein